MPFVNVDGRHVHYDCPRELPSSVGHTVLLVHGAFDDHRLWTHVYTALETDHTPVAIDLPGRGGSDWPALEGAGEQLDFLTELTDQLGLERFVICGHSMGGSIALHYTLEHPARVSGLIPLGSSPEWVLEPADIEAWLNPEAAYKLNLDYLFSKKTSKELIADYDRQLRQTCPKTCRADIESCLTFDLRARLADIRAPTCVICGDEENWKDGSIAIHEQVAGSSYHEVAASGHAVALEQPEALVEIIRSFLASLRDK